MPTYDYRCAKCGRRFHVAMPIAEHGRKKVRCPKCASAKVVQQLNSFFAQTSKKS